jgi:hypothetical protein
VATQPFTSFVELTFPTADPESQGTGKYQFSVGAKTAFPLPLIGFCRVSRRPMRTVVSEQWSLDAGQVAWSLSSAWWGGAAMRAREAR